MRALKVWTTTLLILGMLLLMSAPVLLLRRPLPGAPRPERATFAITMTIYVVVLLIVFFAVVVLAWRLLVQQREEYRVAHLENLKDLVEGSLEDHRKRQGPEEG